MMRFDLSTYLVLDPQLCGARGVVETARAAVRGGATMVQLRDKAADTARMVATGRALQQALAGTGATLIINDDVAAVRELGGCGLHVGQGDLPAAEARARIGPEAILGLSVETVAQAAQVDPALVDYIGAGPVHATATKPDHEPPVGFDGLARIIAACPLPAVAIGGLKPGHGGAARAAGAAGMAFVSAVCGQSDPEGAARALAREWSALA
ncbi:thiamine phosphate synthase [Pseudooceanicola aestuarii]|uniref:thiamine phosphate synthase n=1 Tax=Pseudooceanicola aestuarii TaxID=2697319 RepID=UPI0013CF5A15|nr:thiamine phosphate synthase [Pseudooceanicola aestuarii]